MAAWVTLAAVLLSSHGAQTPFDYSIGWIGNTWGGGSCGGRNTGCHVHAHTAGVYVCVRVGVNLI
jgi:hypothetical protein